MAMPENKSQMQRRLDTIAQLAGDARNGIKTQSLAKALDKGTDELDAEHRGKGKIKSTTIFILKRAISRAVSNRPRRIPH